MKTLMTIRLGGHQVHSGALPLRAGRMFDDLLAALQEAGGDAAIWQDANPHIAIRGSGSTVATIEIEDALEPIARSTAAKFLDNAQELRFGPRGRRFVESHFGPSCPWEFLEVRAGDSTLESPGKILRFDREYRKRVEEKAAKLFESEEEFYAEVVRVGGGKPTAQVDLQGVEVQGGRRSFNVRSKDIARKLGERLYETVRLFGIAKWDPVTMELVDFEILTFDENWQDRHLADLIDEETGSLPIKLTIDDTDELEKMRRLEWVDS